MKTLWLNFGGFSLGPAGVSPSPRKPILPTQEEIGGNPRSKSAKLRVFERI